jgi:Trypsin-like peptidase domain
MKVGLAILVFLVGGAIRHDRPEARYLELAKRPEFAAVGMVTASGDKVGSAVLITPTWVLTAAHLAAGGFPGHTTVSWGTYVSSIATVVVHPNADIALLRLSAPITGFRPASLYRKSDELGHEAISVGFGIKGHGLQAMGAIFGSAADSTKLKRAGENRIDQIGEEGILMADFDHPTDSRYNMMGDAKPLDLEYLPLPGDSGGGLYIRDDDEWKLAGITVSGITPLRDVEGVGNPSKAMAYGHIAKWERVSSFVDWIQDTVEEPD